MSDNGNDQLSAPVLRQHRQQAGLTQQALADLAGLSVRTLRDLEVGRARRPRRSTMTRLADALGLADRDRARLLRSPSKDHAAPVRVEVLGPVRVITGGVATPVGSVLQRSLLALLALRSGRPAELDEIVEALWGADPPPSHRTIVQGCVAALRQLLEPQRHRYGQGDVLALVPGGYQLQLPAARLDVADFRAQVAAGRMLAAKGKHGAAALHFRLAAGLWRGPIAADTPIRHQPEASALAAERIRTTLEWSDAALACGHFREIAPTLQAIVREEPLHEALHARLMLVLAAGGERAAALVAFADIRGRLAEELGLEPGEELRAAQLRILNQQAIAPIAVAGPRRGHASPRTRWASRPPA